MKRPEGALECGGHAAALHQTQNHNDLMHREKGGGHAAALHQMQNPNDLMHREKGGGMAAALQGARYASATAISVPPSKSHSMRAILFGALAEGTSVVKGLLDSPDVEKMVVACKRMGAQFEGERIVGCRPKGGGEIDAGNSGIVLRFLGAIAGLSDQETTIIGDHSKRPLKPLEEGLRQLGATVSSNGQRLSVRGPIMPGKAKLNGQDSQPVSGLLMAASLLNGVTELEVESPGETPWIEVTLEWLRRLGIRVDCQDYRHYKIIGGTFHPFEYTVPGDWSSAAFPLVAAAISNNTLHIPNLDFNDIQGDKKIVDVLQAMGADIETGNGVLIHGGKPLHGIEIDVGKMIDALPILAVLGCVAEGKTRLYNGAIARQKESDRISAITNELRKLGADITEHPDGLTILPAVLRGGTVYSHCDHRIALSLMVASLITKGPLSIEESHWIAKTYPDFPEQLDLFVRK